MSERTGDELYELIVRHSARTPLTNYVKHGPIPLPPLLPEEGGGMAERQPTDGEVFHAMLTVNYHTGYEVSVGGRGTHGFYNVITARATHEAEDGAVDIRTHEFVFPDDAPRFVAWARSIGNREANAPLREP